MSVIGQGPPDRAIDPVSGAELAPPSETLSLWFRGARYFFETHATRMAFKSDPERWAQARPEAAVSQSPGPRPPPRTRAASPFKVVSGPPPKPPEAD